jgi:hypothetical protein
MQATTAARTNLDYLNQQNEQGAGIRALQNVVLSELPGVTFAAITLLYVLTALIGL